MRKSKFKLNLRKLNYKKYFKQFKLDRLIDVKNFKTSNFSPSYIFENNNKTPYPPDLEDLIRIHYIITSRRVTTVLEFGVGYSTLFIADALKNNYLKYNKFVSKNLRRSNAFKVFSVDSNKKYISIFNKKIPRELKTYIKLNYSNSSIEKYNDQITSKIDKLPNVTPDFIYVDGPSFLDIKGNIDGLNFRDKDRTILNCNLLRMENLLLPGTLIVWDGQTNNARFNMVNFKRNWKSERLDEYDISYSEQIEDPLGYLNNRQIKFSKL